MENFGGLLSKEESAILEEASEEVRKFQKRLAFSVPAVEKSTFAKMGVKRQAEVLSAELENNLKTFRDLTKTANYYYGELKGKMDEGKTTHQFITARALDFLGIGDHAFCDQLEISCMEPDRNKKNWELAYEGHFFGKIDHRRFGNFFPRVLKKPVLQMLDRVNDIDETAASNFSGQYATAFQDKTDLGALGRAAHYLQDLTAPHHVGNMAIFFEMITDHTNTHYPFEKYARKYVYDHKDSIAQTAQPWFDRFKGVFDPQKPEKIAKSVYHEAVVNLPHVKTHNPARWEKTVCHAIPMAIGATAVILEPWK